MAKKVTKLSKVAPIEHQTYFLAKKSLNYLKRAIRVGAIRVTPTSFLPNPTGDKIK